MYRERARRRQPILLPEAGRDEFQQQCWLPEQARMLQVLERDRCRTAWGGTRTAWRRAPTRKDARDAQLVHDHGTCQRHHEHQRPPDDAIQDSLRQTGVCDHAPQPSRVRTLRRWRQCFAQPLPETRPPATARPVRLRERREHRGDPRDARRAPLGC